VVEAVLKRGRCTVMSKQITKRLLQVTMLPMLGVLGNTALMFADDICPTQGCQSCDDDPNWHGSCYAGLEGCEVYGCWSDGVCTPGGSLVLNQCYCPEC